MSDDAEAVHRPHNHARQRARLAARQALFQRSAPLVAGAQAGAALLVSWAALPDLPIAWLLCVAGSLALLLLSGFKRAGDGMPGHPGWPNALSATAAGALGGAAFGVAATVAWPWSGPPEAGIGALTTGLATGVAALSVTMGRAASPPYGYAFFVAMGVTAATAAMFASIATPPVPVAMLALAGLGVAITRIQDRALRSRLETQTERDEQAQVIVTLLEQIEALRHARDEAKDEAEDRAKARTKDSAED